MPLFDVHQGFPINTEHGVQFRIPTLDTLQATEKYDINKSQGLRSPDRLRRRERS